MNQYSESARNDLPQSAARKPARSRRWALAGMAAVVFGTMSIAGISHAQEGPGGQRPHGMGMHGSMDPAKAEKRIEHMIDHLLPDATPDQKARVTAIARTAMSDLRPLHEKQRAAHMSAMKILSAPTIDRAALERNRADELQTADQISRRRTQALADAADVLTPAQRVKLAEHFSKRRGHKE